MRKPAAALVFAFSSVARLASAQGPVGAEFQVNVYTTDDQREAAVAVRPGGSFVVVWRSENQDGSSYGVFARPYDAVGAAGVETRVNTYTTNSQRSATVAATTDGGFVVVWHSSTQDGSSYGVFGQRYDAAFVPQGAEFRVNSYTTGFQGNPAVAATPGGGFLVAFDVAMAGNFDVFAQRYDDGGAPQGPQFRVNSYTTNYQGSSSIAVNAAGEFVVAWTSVGQDGSMAGIFAQRFSAAGSPQGAELAVNTYTSFPQAFPAVAIDAAGNFVVAWGSNYEDGAGIGVFGRRYDAAGVPSAPFRVNVFTSFDQSNAAVAMDPSGGFVVAWEGSAAIGVQVSGRAFNSGGAPVTGDFQINAQTPFTKRAPAIAPDPNGTFVVAWETRDVDGSQYGIFARRLGGLDLIFEDGFE
jgi:hypothetical protein